VISGRLLQRFCLSAAAASSDVLSKTLHSRSIAVNIKILIQLWFNILVHI